DGFPLQIRPTMNNEPAGVESLYAFWSDGRSSQKDAALKKIDRQTLEIPAMRAGDNSVLLVKLEGNRATHFSKITDFRLKAGEKNSLEIPLRPAARMT